MGWLDKLLGRAKGATGRGTGTGGGREGARVTEQTRTSGEGTRPTPPAGTERREGAGGPEGGGGPERM
jgi:hypothetical protein